MNSSDRQNSGGLTVEQVDEFHERGFLSLGKILDDDRVALLRTEYDKVFELAQTTGEYRNLAMKQELPDSDEKKASPTQMLQIMQMCERNIHYRQLLFHSPTLDIVESLLGPNLQLFHDQALFKPAHCGGPVFWHQDNAYWKCVPANLVSVWMTLDDVDASNGAMHVIPGSHLQSVAHDPSSEAGLLLDLKDSVDAAKAVVIELPAGGAMLHHCQTLHYTPPNHTDRQRRAVIVHFMTPGTRSLSTGAYIPVSFTNPMLRMKM